MSNLGAGALDLTPKELFVVAKARHQYEQENAWWHTANLMALVYNMVATKQNKRSPRDFHPMYQSERSKTKKTSLRDFSNSLKKEKSHGKESR